MKKLIKKYKGYIWYDFKVRIKSSVGKIIEGQKIKEFF